MWTRFYGRGRRGREGRNSFFRNSRRQRFRKTFHEKIIEFIRNAWNWNWSTDRWKSLVSALAAENNTGRQCQMTSASAMTSRWLTEWTIAAPTVSANMDTARDVTDNRKSPCSFSERLTPNALEWTETQKTIVLLVVREDISPSHRSMHSSGNLDENERERENYFIRN